jgi:integrase/recombinase XerD
MKDSIQLYLNRLRVLARSIKTLRNVRGYLGHHADWLEVRSIYHPDKVRLSHLENYIRHVLRRCAPNSTAIQTRLLIRFYRFLAAQKVIARSPAAGIFIPKIPYPLPPAPPDGATIWKLAKSIDTTKPVGLRNRAILETLFSTGLRMSELLNLEVGDVRMKDLTIMVRSGKGNKDRIVLLSKRAHQILNDYMCHARPKLAEGLPGHEGWAEFCRQNHRSPDRCSAKVFEGNIVPNVRKGLNRHGEIVANMGRSEKRKRQ